MACRPIPYTFKKHIGHSELQMVWTETKTCFQQFLVHVMLEPVTTVGSQDNWKKYFEW